MSGDRLPVAFIADIHGNLEALTAVLADIDAAGIDRIVSLGDNVGYGADPEAVVLRLRQRAIPSLLGNHELALINERYRQSLNPRALESIATTRRLISPATLAYIETLPSAFSLNGCLCVHGCPPDSVTRYLFHQRRRVLARIFAGYEEVLCFHGHTHNLSLHRRDPDGTIATLPTSQGTVQLACGSRYIVGIGSVGQPRDGSNTAKYLIHRPADSSVEFRAVAYDIATAAGKIIAAGLPEFNATRLW